MDSTQTGHHDIPLRPPPAEEGPLDQTKSEHTSRSTCVQKCLDRGTWTLTDGELDIVTTPQQDISDSKALQVLVQCVKEQGYRREAARETRLLQRYRLVERRYLELVQDNIHKDKSSSEASLKSLTTSSRSCGNITACGMR